jgi:hypothetical protein
MSQPLRRLSTGWQKFTAQVPPNPDFSPTEGPLNHGSKADLVAKLSDK